MCAADGMFRSFGVINAAGGVVVGQRNAVLFHHGIGVGDGGQQTLGVRMNRVGEKLLLPCNMLRSGERVFLDDVTVEELENALQVPVHIVKSDGQSLFEEFLDISYI